jgi:hypothetical protein
MPYDHLGLRYRQLLGREGIMVDVRSNHGS